MLLLQMMMVAKFKLNEENFVDIKISLMLLLQMMTVAILKITNDIGEFKDIIDVTLANYDGRNIQAHK